MRRIATRDRSLGTDRRTRKAGIVVDNSPSILVVDGLSETTDVLKAVFEPRGHSVNRIRHSQLPQSSLPQPRVVVWHATESDDSPAADRFAGVPRIVIGRTAGATAANGSCRFSQPFEYGALLHAIEALLSE